MKRNVDYIVIHCTGTPTDTTVASIQRYWREDRGWRHPGYHFIVAHDGKLTQLLPLARVANGARGYNGNGIHIAYIGGIDTGGTELDTRSRAQRDVMAGLARGLHGVFPEAQVCGHRDLPAVKKFCPSFDVRGWLRCLGHE